MIIIFVLFWTVSFFLSRNEEDNFPQSEFKMIYSTEFEFAVRILLLDAAQKGFILCHFSVNSMNNY